MLVAINAEGQAPEAVTRRFRQCRQQFEAGSFQAARACFKDVYDKYPSAPVAYNIGRTEEELGRLVESYDYYQRAASDARGGLTPAEQAQAREAMTRILPRLGFVWVRTDVPAASVWIDAHARPEWRKGPVMVTPGTYLVRVEAPGKKAWQTRVKIAAGITRQVNPVLKELRPPTRLSARTGVGLGLLAASLGFLATGIVGTYQAGRYAASGDALLASHPWYSTTKAARLHDMKDRVATYNGLSVGMYAAAGVAVVVAAVLLLTGRRTGERRGAAARSGLHFLPTAHERGIGFVARAPCF